MFRRTANLGEFAELKVPMQLRYVRRLADESGVGLKGVKVRIVRDSGLVGSGYHGTTNVTGTTIYLYPDAFKDLQTLSRTLGHERTHVMQRRIFGQSTDARFVSRMEDAAFGIESEFWRYYLQNNTGTLEMFR
jgi:hypothetical protein